MPRLNRAEAPGPFSRRGLLVLAVQITMRRVGRPTAIRLRSHPRATRGAPAPCSRRRFLAHRSKLGAHRRNSSCVVGRLENCRSGHEGVGARLGDRGDVVDLDASIHLEPYLATGPCCELVDARAHVRELGQRLGDERLPSESGIHRHDQHQIQFVEHMIETVERRCRIEHQSGLASAVVDKRDGAIDVLGSFEMKADDRRSCLGEVRHDPVHRLHHEMHVDRHAGDGLDRLAYQRADGEIGDVMVVHHVEVNQVSAGGDYGADFLAQASEVGGENRRRNLAVSHRVIIPRSRAKSVPVAESKKYEITIVPKAIYVDEQSEPAKNQYVFAYTIMLTNTGSVPAQLISRHWVITDANNKVLEVKGLGVIGQQPLLKPGESFEYSSGTHLETSVGTMRGTYQMLAEDGHAFDAPIPLFTLSVPRVLH